MITATANLLALPAKYLAQLVASSQTFREQVGAIDEADALRTERQAIFIGLAETDPDEAPNRAIVRHLDAADLELVADSLVGGEPQFVLTFEFPQIEIGQSVDGEKVETLQDQYVHFCNTIGAIVQEMARNARNASTDNGYLAAENWEQGALGWAAKDENNALGWLISEWMVSYQLRIQ